MGVQWNDVFNGKWHFMTSYNPLSREYNIIYIYIKVVKRALKMWKELSKVRMDKSQESTNDARNILGVRLVWKWFTYVV
jgi:hypothetical protein